jgi:hypothetical protein
MHVEAIWLRHIGDKVQVLFHFQGVSGWRLAIEESVHGSFSHIVEFPKDGSLLVDRMTYEP